MNPTPEERARLSVKCHCLTPDWMGEGFHHDEKCPVGYVGNITEAIQSAERPLRERIEELEKGENDFLETIYKQLCQLCHMGYPIEYKGRGVWIHTGHTSCSALELRNAVENLRFQSRQALKGEGGKG